jgi:hypothetical protein
MNNYFLNNSTDINIQKSYNITLKNSLTLLGEKNKSIILDINIVADFSTIPEKYHEVFLNMLTSKYYNQTSFGYNPFSKCLPPNKKKWYEFWKIKK